MCFTIIFAFGSRLLLPTMSRTGQYCVTFAYHMFGHHTGRLELNRYASSRGQTSVLWQQARDHGDQWLTARETVQLSAGDRLQFVGQRATGYSGEIGLDSIDVSFGAC